MFCNRMYVNGGFKIIPLLNNLTECVVFCGQVATKGPVDKLALQTPASMWYAPMKDMPGKPTTVLALQGDGDRH